MIESLFDYTACGVGEDVNRLIELANNIPSGETRSISLGNGYDSDDQRNLTRRAWGLASNLQGHVLGWTPQVRVKNYRSASGVSTQRVFLDIYKHKIRRAG